MEVVDQEYVPAFPLSEIVPDPLNPWAGDDEAVGESIDALGFYGAVLVQRGSNRLIAGHTRVRQAQARGAESVPALVVDADDLWQSRALVGDNRTNNRGRFLDEPLAVILGRLKDADALAGTGFRDDDLRSVMARLDAATRAAHVRTAVDDAPARAEVAVTRLGDVWELGPHRLVCGDATDPAVYERLLGGERVQSVWTDPPYGVEYVGVSHAYSPEVRKALGGREIANDEIDPEKLRGMLGAAFDAAVGVCAPGASWFVTAPPGPLFAVFGSELGRLGIWRQTLVWLKDQLVMGRSDYHYRHEAMFFGWVPGAGHHRPPSRTFDSVWQFDRPSRSAEHPTMKPVGLIQQAIENHTDPGDLVLDMFAGSGSTLIAAHGLGRDARLVELDPLYCDVICRRYAEHTGGQPLRDGVSVFEVVDA